MTSYIQDLQPSDVSRIIEMAWEDRTPFEAIEKLYGLSESEVITLMRTNINRKTFENWRARVSGRKTKHKKLRHPDVERGYCKTQYKPVRKR
ncbi:TIGR03643 family protein [Glaciecola sp. 1036]|uniref:TIGR03643 family protein n=1 Tax=Alteromonadaceae TaxID=72275 RepID=UPI003D056FB7